MEIPLSLKIPLGARLSLRQAMKALYRQDLTRARSPVRSQRFIGAPCSRSKWAPAGLGAELDDQ